MSNIYVEAKGPKGIQLKESLQLSSVPASPSRGLAVTYGSDTFHATVVAAAAALAVVGILEEDAVAVVRGGVNTVGEPNTVIEFGQAVAQIGASVTALQPLTTNASGQLVPANPGQPIVALALEAQTYVSPGSFACVLVVAILGLVMPGSPVSYVTAAGAIPLVSGTVIINGAAALAMTLGVPPADGIVIKIFAGTAHAHTVTAAADTINNTKDTITYAAIGDVAVVESVGGKWLIEAIGGPTPAALSEV